MSKWDREQAERLAFEAGCLEEHMASFRFYEPSGDTYVEGCAWTSGRSRKYRARITIPNWYPHEQPSLYIIEPHALPMYANEGTVNDLGACSAFHTHSNGLGGCVRVCYIDNWDSSMNCVFILGRLHLWLEAYELHLATGKPLGHFLNTTPAKGD